MQALILVNKGLEKSAQKEIKLLTNKKSVIGTGCLFFECERDELIKLSYLGRSFTRVLEIIGIRKDLDFEIDLEYEGAVGFKIIKETDRVSTQEIFDAIKKKLISKKYEIDMKHPEIPLIIFSDGEKNYLCLDYSGFDLSKRDYKIFAHKDTLKGNIIAGILLEEDIAGNIILDPFCKDGTIAIESAMIQQNKSINYFNKEKFAFLRLFDLDVDCLEKLDDLKEGIKVIAADTNFANISSAKKNSVLAEVEKEIRFLKCEIDDIDLKFEKEIDFIITSPLQVSKVIPEKKVIKIAEQFFTRAKKILSEKGKIILLIKRVEEIYEQKGQEKGFSIIDKKEIMQGQDKIKVIKFKLN